MNSKHITNYKPKDFAELLGVSVKTLQRWDRENILKAKRTPTDRRYYTYEQYLEFKGINNADNDRKTVIYTRVSTNGQKDYLKNQIEFLLNFTSSKGIIVDETIEDIGSGLNYNRKKWNFTDSFKMMKAVYSHMVLQIHLQSLMMQLRSYIQYSLNCLSLQKWKNQLS